jgi:hypothetical protein
MEPSVPIHTPGGCERIDEAYRRDVQPLGPEARERVRQALADGIVKALHVSEKGDPGETPRRIWIKPPFEDKVYPTFETGRARYWLDREKRTEKLWFDIFVPVGSLVAVVTEDTEKTGIDDQTAESTAEEVDRYKTGMPGRPTIKYKIIAEFEFRAKTGQIEPSIKKQGEALHKWAEENHEEAARPMPRSIETIIRSRYNKAKRATIDQSA